ncbi:hypothetical protein QJS66_11860 [Kocuria rhizophila]|nr:hypothetical protein QJS66_11860 [Kocuria rhizophila]
MFTYRPLIDNIRSSFTAGTSPRPRPRSSAWTTTSSGSRTPSAGRSSGTPGVHGVRGGGSTAPRARTRTAAGPEAQGTWLRPLLRVRAVRDLRRAAVGVAFSFVFDPSYGLVQDLLRWVGLESPT